MTNTIKTALLTVAALAITAGVSAAAPSKHSNHGYGKSGYAKQVKHDRGLSGFERAKIAQSAASLRNIKARAWRDGKLSFAERMQINRAERRHAALVARSYRS